MTSKPTWQYYAITIILFVITIGWGYHLGQNAQNVVANLKNSLPFSPASLSPWALFLLIFLNNSIKTFIVLVLSFFFAVAPLYFIYANGVLIGMVFALAASQARLPLAFAGIIPHGILEFPALVITISYGLWLGVSFVSEIRKRGEFLPHLKHAMRTYLYVILPLLLVAALIESFITPSIMRLFY